MALVTGSSTEAWRGTGEVWTIDYEQDPASLRIIYKIKPGSRVTNVRVTTLNNRTDIGQQKRYNATEDTVYVEANWATSCNVIAPTATTPGVYSHFIQINGAAGANDAKQVFYFAEGSAKNYKIYTRAVIADLLNNNGGGLLAEAAKALKIITEQNEQLQAAKDEAEQANGELVDAINLEHRLTTLEGKVDQIVAALP